MSRIDHFLDSRSTDYHQCRGEYTLWSAFKSDFLNWQPTPHAWTAKKLRQRLDEENFPVGPGTGNRLVVGNVSDCWQMPRQYVKLKNGTVRLES